MSIEIRRGRNRPVLDTIHGLVKIMIDTPITAPIPVIGYLPISRSIGTPSIPSLVSIEVLEPQFSARMTTLCLLALTVAVVEITRGE
jgi:hypothetical protein